MEQPNHHFIEKLDYLQDLYIKSREAIALLENYNKGKESFLGPHNELRNALDHIMKMIRSKNDIEVCEKEYRGAESHLLRAGYDSFELICINQIQYIKEILGQYAAPDISIGFPDYYKEIRKEILNIEKETAKLRETKRQEDSHGKDTFEFYFEAAEKLITYVKRIDEHIPIINECYNERINREKKIQKTSKHGMMWGIIGAIIGLIGFLYAYFK